MTYDDAKWLPVEAQVVFAWQVVIDHVEKLVDCLRMCRDAEVDVQLDHSVSRGTGLDLWHDDMHIGKAHHLEWIVFSGGICSVVPDKEFIKAYRRAGKEGS